MTVPESFRTGSQSAPSGGSRYSSFRMECSMRGGALVTNYQTVAD